MQKDEVLKSIEQFLENQFDDINDEKQLATKGVKIMPPNDETPCYIVSVSKSAPIPSLINYFEVLYHMEQNQTPTKKNKKQIVVGLDCEFAKEKNRVATIQIGTRYLAYIFQMVHILKDSSDTFPESLKIFLESQNIIKCGVFIHNDKKCMIQTFGKNGLKNVPSLVDLGDLAVKEGITRGDYRSLKDFATELLNLTNDTSATSGSAHGRWSSVQLSDALVRYAGLDAHIGIRTAEVLYKYLSPERDNKTLFQWITLHIAKESQQQQTPAISRKEIQMIEENDRFAAQRKRLAQVKNKSGEMMNTLKEKKRKRDHQSVVEHTLDDLLSEMKGKQPQEKKHKNTNDDNIMLNLV
jgi:translation initiation factor IF-3